jgi:hypothetical protein
VIRGVVAGVENGIDAGILAEPPAHRASLIHPRELGIQHPAAPQDPHALRLEQPGDPSAGRFIAHVGQSQMNRERTILLLQSDTPHSGQPGCDPAGDPKEP